LERRRVLDAAITDLVFAPADVDGSTAVHDSNEGTSVTTTAAASGFGALLYEWKLTQGANVVAQSNNPAFQFTPLDDGNYSVTLKITDSAQSTASRTESLIVHNVRPVLVVAVDQMVDEGSPLDLSAVGAPPLGLFIDKGILDTHTATVDWGDGSALESPTIFAAAGSGALGGTHTYADNGVYEVIVSIADDDGGSDTQSFFVTVNNVAPTATLSNNGPVNEGASATVTFGGQFDPSTDDTAAGFHYAYDVDNNGTFDVGDGSYAGSGPNDSQIISAALFADGPGTRTVKARIIDQDGGFTDYTTDVTINNVAPQLINVAVDDATINEGQTATIRMTIDDPGAIDVFEVDVDWKDGAPVDTIAGLGMTSVSGTVGGTTYQWDAQSRELTVSHLYEDDNPTATSSDTYAVALAVRDDDLGASGPHVVNVVVSNVRPVLVVATDQMVGEGALLDLSAVGAPPLALFVDDGLLDTHTATVDWGDGSPLEMPALFAGPGSGALGATHSYQDNGVYLVTITVTDDDGGSDMQSFQVAVGNVAPTAVLTNNGPVNEGSSATVSFSGQFDPSTTDTAAGFRYAYDLDNNGTFDVGNGTYAGSVATSSQLVSAALLADGPGTRTVKARILDKDGGFTDYTTTITINNVAPELINIVVDDATIDEGETAAITMTIDDPGTLDTFEVDVDWKDGGPIDTIPDLGAMNASGTVGGTIYEWDAQSRELTVSHLYRDDNPTATASDPYTVMLAVRDDDLGATGPYNVNLTVSNVRPVLVVADGQTVNEGALLDLSAMGAPPLALFIDDGKLDTHVATVNWGDGTAVQVPTIFFAVGSGALGASHTYADNGVYTVTVTVTDDDGGFDSQSFLVTVENVAPTLSVTPSAAAIDEGSEFSFNAIFSDPGFDNPLNPGAEKQESFTYDVSWGDNRDAISGMSVGDTNGMPGVNSTGMFSGSHIYADNGDYLVAVTIHDDDGGSHVQSFIVTVDNVAPTLALPNGDQTINEGALLSLANLGTFTDPGVDNPLNPGAEKQESFTYDVDWGDGRDAIVGQAVADTDGSPAVFSTGSFDGSHTFADNGTYTVKVTIHDDDDGSHIQMFTVIVANVDPTLTGTTGHVVDEGAIFTLTGLGVALEDPGFDNPLNTLDPANGGELSETFEVMKINWGDGSIDDNTDADPSDPVSIVNRVSGGVNTPTTAQFNHSAHAYADNGLYTVTITLKDDDGNFVDRQFTIQVDNVEPSLALTDASFTINEGQTLSIPNLGTFTDHGFNNSLNPLQQPGGSVESFTYTINWGDGQQDTGQLPASVVNGAQGVLTTGTIANSHFYADNDADNKYTITVTLSDDDGGVDVQTIEVTVLNVNPTLQPIAATDVNANTGTTTLTLTFSDPGADSFQIMVDWGDNLGIPNPADRFEVEQLYSGPTPNTFVIVHQYAGPPDPLNPTADIVISVKILDDDFGTLGVVDTGESNVQTAAISNPGIQVINVAIDTTPDVPRLDLTVQPMVDMFISGQGGLGQLFQVPDVRGGGGEVAATTERYLELRIVNPDGTESEGYRIKDEALADLRAFFKTLPDGRYAIYLVRTENHSERLVIEVDVRRGRVIDVSDDSEGTRDRPPTGEEEAPQAVPLDQNPLLETVPAEEKQGDLETKRQGEIAEIGDNGDQQASLSPPLLVSLSMSAAALAAQPWSRRVDAALVEADETAWRRLRRAGRTGRTGRLLRPCGPALDANRRQPRLQ
jgi:PKD repeat protein